MELTAHLYSVKYCQSSSIFLENTIQIQNNIMGLRIAKHNGLRVIKWINNIVNQE